ncbi:MAG TPA: lytic transglycosylase domain-containing protein [Sphingomicrobium sp.]|nr:lytic transglycosylase domain-containing protein [Sphingomicrobium sp.]
MSSMGRAAYLIPLLLVFTASASAQILPSIAQSLRSSAPVKAPSRAAPPTAAALAVQAYSADSVASSIAQWERLRQGGNLAFAHYAQFLNANAGWPGESRLRRAAEAAMRPGENAILVLGFYRTEKPMTGSGWARYADALAASGRTAEAVEAAKQAWASSGLNAADEAAILARYGNRLNAQDHNRRVDALLTDRKATSAQRLLAWTTPDRRAAFAARVAMQSRAPDTEALLQSAAHRISADAGLLADRIRYLREGGNEQAARQLAAQPHQFTEHPADPERWYELLLELARGAAADRQFTLAYNIARQIDDAFPPGTQLPEQSYGVRDHYTSLAWLAGQTALDRLRNPSNATAMFYRYAQGGKSLQVATKGFYWAGRSALASGNAGDANAYFRRAGLYPELFYAQLALERVGQSVPAPGFPQAVGPADPARAAFARNSLVRAVRHIVHNGNSRDQAIFIRALAESLDSQAERTLAMELSKQLGRPDLGVWIGRAARNAGEAYYVRDAFPTLRQTPRSSWSLANAITRQESSFDVNAVSHAGARGLMQLMPGTAREQAGKLGIAYSTSRIHDPDINVMLGSAYFQRMMNAWNGSVPLAVASYNAGPGNVRKWINAYGDPRTGSVDVLGWVEAIPFSETRGYVQRVIENSVVYDTLNPQAAPQAGLHVSRYLGKATPG